MAEQLQVVITGKDGVSKVFQQISSGAQDVGKSVEQAGKRGAKGMDDLGKSAEQNAKRMERVKAEATAIGAVMGVLAAGVIQTGAAFRDQERQIDGINRIYGEQAETILQLSENMQNFTRYSNDAAREGALIAGSLATNYDVSAESIGLLIERSADLAQIYGYSLPDAIQRTSSAIRGEGESAEALGLNLSDAAIAARALEAGITNWGVPGALSEAEKAAFRMTLFLEDTEKTAGAAGAAAEGAGGSFRQFANELQDGAQAVGGFLGPIGEVGAELAPIAMALPVVAAGVGNLVGRLRGSALAMSALGMATNPVVLGLGAIAAAGVLVYQGFQQQGEEARLLKSAYEDLIAVQNELALAGKDREAAILGEMKAQNLAIVGLAEDRMDTLLNMRSEERLILAEQQDTTWDQMADDYEVTTERADRLTAAQGSLASALGDTRVDADALNQAMADLRTQYMLDPNMSFEEYVAGMEALAVSTANYKKEADATTTSVSGLANVLDAATGGLSAVAEGHELAAAAAKVHADTISGGQAAIDASIAAQTEYISQLMQVAGMGDPLSQWNLAGHADGAMQLADNLNDVSAAMESTFRAIVGNTNAIGQQMQGLDDWATNLIGDPGYWAEVDALLNEGRISLEQYSDAQQAQIDISTSNGIVQRDLLAIQAQQSPILAESARNMEQYVFELRQLNDGYNDAADGAQQQLAALGFLDASLSDRSMQIAQMAAGLDELGPAGRTAFQGMIEGIIATDPVMTAMLVSMGLVEEKLDASGNKTYTVDLDGADQAISDLDRLNTTIVDLVDILDDGKLNGSYTMRMAIEGGDEVKATLDAVNDAPTEKTVKVNIAESATGVLSRLFGGAGDGDGTGGAAYTIPVDADTAPIEAAIAALPATIPPIEIPVSVKMASMDQRREDDAAYFGGISQQIEMKVGLDTSAVDAKISELSATDIPDVTFAITADSSAADTAISAIDRATIADKTLIIYGDNTAAYEAVNNVNNLGIDSKTLYILGDASGALNSINLVRNYDGVTLATSYVDIVTRSTRISAERHGGIAGYAHGGIPVELAEAGGEMLHFSTGGVMPIHDRGVYNVPPHTYVSPANANSGRMYGDINVTVQVQGDVMSDDQLASKVIGPITQAMTTAIERQERGMGGR